MRAASGLLLSAHPRPASTASTATHDAREAVGLLVSAAERQRVLLTCPRQLSQRKGLEVSRLALAQRAPSG
ncbi:MAG: hypothetical protein ACOVPA_04610 [Rubrivivax sp.]